MALPANTSMYRPVYDINLPVDSRVVTIANNLGVTSAPPAPLPTNANDPVSPQRGSEGVGGTVDAPVGMLHAFPDDQGRTPQYTPTA